MWTLNRLFLNHEDKLYEIVKNINEANIDQARYYEICDEIKANYKADEILKDGDLLLFVQKVEEAIIESESKWSDHTTKEIIKKDE